MSVPFWPATNLASNLTIDDLIVRWCGNPSCGIRPSTDWLKRRQSTRSRYSLKLDEIRGRWGPRALGDFEGRKGRLLIGDWRSELQETPRAADELVRVLNSLFEFGRMEGLIRHNPAADIPELGCANDYAHVFWSDADLQRFRDVSHRMSLRPVADFIDLMALTGLGVEEAIRLRFDDVTDLIVYRPVIEEARPRRGLPAYPLLLEAKDFIENLKRRRRHFLTDTVLVDANGASWGRTWVQLQVKNVRDAAKIDHVDWTTGEAVVSPKHVKDLRKTWAVKAMRSGATDDDIATLTRWKPSDIAKLRTLASLRPHVVDVTGLTWPERV